MVYYISTKNTASKIRRIWLEDFLGGLLMDRMYAKSLESAACICITPLN